MVRFSGILGFTLFALFALGAQSAYARTSSGQSTVNPPHELPTASLTIEHSSNQAMRAIREAARHSGVDADFLIAMAHIESGFDATARARTSSAAGLFQFIEGTWLTSVERYGADLHGDVIPDRVMSRAELLDLRFDPRMASMLAAASTRDNAIALNDVLGRRATYAELYLAHFLGTGGARKFVSAMNRNPSTQAARLFPRAAQANRAIFYFNGNARSLEGVLRHFEEKISGVISERGHAQDWRMDDAVEGQNSLYTQDSVGPFSGQVEVVVGQFEPVPAPVSITASTHVAIDDKPVFAASLASAALPTMSVQRALSSTRSSHGADLAPFTTFERPTSSLGNPETRPLLFELGITKATNPSAIRGIPDTLETVSKP